MNNKPFVRNFYRLSEQALQVQQLAQSNLKLGSWLLPKLQQRFNQFSAAFCNLSFNQKVKGWVDRFVCVLMLPTLLIAFTSCDSYFGDKTSTDFLEKPTGDKRKVAYVPIQPAFDDFEYPIDVMAGFDDLIYVADSATDEISSYDVSGSKIGDFKIPGLSAIQQLRNLDILALGTTDSTISDSTYTLSTIYYINMMGDGGYGLDHASIQKRIVHPFYFKNSFSEEDALVSFKGLAIRKNNGFYVSRTGPNNSAQQFGGPDDAVLRFNNNTNYESPILVRTQTGLFRDFFNQPKALTTSLQPPQKATATSDGDFFVSTLSPNDALKVKKINREESQGGVTYRLENLPTGDTSKANGFLYEPFKFSKPVDITQTGDGSNYLFVVDTEQDSLYQFTTEGYEGAQPPPAANRDKFVKVSFGGTGSGPKQFINPEGVDYLQEMLYVADGGNGRVLRFKLTTDIE